MNTNTDAEIEQVELSMAEAEKIRDFGHALERLERNPDFKKVILDGYFYDEASRLVMLTAEINLKPEQKEAVHAGIRGIGELRQFLMARKQMGQMADKEIIDHRDTLVDLRTGEGE